MSIWRRFGEEIARTEDEMLSEDERVARVRGRLLETTSGAAADSRARPSGGRLVLSFGLATAVVVAVGLVAYFVPWQTASALEATIGDERRPLRVGEWVAAPAETARRIDFSDGSSVSLEPRSGARVVSLAADGARVSLERGTARVAVHKRRDTQWQIDVGPYAVSVKGTRFVVAWDSEAQLFTLTLEEGSVFVRGPLLAEGRMIAVDETLRASVAHGRLEILKGAAETAARTETPGRAAAAPSAQPRPDEDTDALQDADPICAQSSPGTRASAPQQGLAAAAPEPVAPESWRKLAASGSYRAAVDAAEVQGVEAVLAEATAPDLLMLGDAARLSKRIDLADRSYLAARARHPNSPEAASAAFALGRLAFDHQQRFAKAAHWMEVYLAEAGADAALAREALGRLVEATQRAGDLDGAQHAAARYLSRYPSGPHAEVARTVLAQTEGAAAAAP